MKKIIILTILFILLSSFAYADLNDGVLAYFPFDDDTLLVDVANGNDMSSSTASSGGVGIINQSFSFSAGSSQFMTSVLNPGNFSSEQTISVWINEDSSNAWAGIVYSRGTATWGIQKWDDASDFCRYYNPFGEPIKTLCFQDVWTGNWFHLAVTFNGTNARFYVNGTLQDSDDSGSASFSTDDFYKIGQDDLGSRFYDGRIDELGFWTRALTADEVLELYNNGSALAYPFPTVTPAGNITSIQGVDFNLSDVTFSTESFFTSHIIFFNTTATDTFGLITSMNILKNSVPGSTNEVFGRISVDGSIISTELLRTVTGTTEGSTGFFPINFTTNSGTHNITLEFARSGLGEVEINDFDFILLKFRSNASDTIRNQFTIGSYNHQNTNFVNGLNWTVSTTAENVSIFNKQNMQATGSARVDYRYEHIDDGTVSNVITRNVDASSIGSAAAIWIHDDDDNNGTHTLSSKASANIVSVNTTILDFDLSDSGNRIIPAFEATNASTNSTNTLTYTAGKHILTQTTTSLFVGDSYFIGATVSMQSNSGAQTPTIIVNSTNTSITCFSKKERSFTGSGSYGNAYAYTLCNSGMIVNGSYTFQLWLEVPAGQTVIVADETLFGMETKEFNIAQSIPDPTIIINNNLVNNTINYKFKDINITYNITAGEGNTIDRYNCSLIVNDVVNQTQINRTDNTSYNFTYDFNSVESDFTFDIRCSNAELNISTGKFNYKVDTIDPGIETFGLFDGQNIFKNLDVLINVTATCSDTNLFACNSSIIQINATDGSQLTVINNTFFTTLSGGNASINFTLKVNPLNNSPYLWQTQGWDSHTTKFIDPATYKIDYLSNGFIVNDDIKIYGNEIKNSLLWFDDVKQDRYKFKITFHEDVTHHKFYIETTEKLEYVPDSEYMGHMVYMPLKKWIDFESPLIKDVDVVKLADNKYELNIELYNAKDEIEFDSIGDLNFNQVNVSFTVLDGFTFFAKNSINAQFINNFTITVFNASGVFQTKNTTIGNITFNITSGMFDVNITSETFANNDTSNLTFTSGGTFTFQLFAENSLFLFFFDEDTGDLLNTTNCTVQVINLANTSQEDTTNTGSVFISGFTPGNYELIFICDGYTQNQFFTTISTSSTQSIDLYQVSNQTASLIIFTIQDEKGNPIQNAIWKRLRLVNLEDNAFIVTGMSKTDANGETAMNLVPNTVFYRFILEKDGVTLFSGSDQQIFSSLVFFRVPILQDVLDSYSIMYDGSLTTLPIDWNNNTNIVSFTWNDASGLTRQGCLQIERRNIFKSTMFGPTCVNSSAATVSINMTGNIDNTSTFLATGYIVTNSTFSEPSRQFLTKVFGSSYKVADKLGLYVAYIMILSMFFLGVTISFSVALVFAMISLVAVQMVGISFFGYSLIVTIGFVGIIVAVAIKN